MYSGGQLILVHLFVAVLVIDFCQCQGLLVPLLLFPHLNLFLASLFVNLLRNPHELLLKRDGSVLAFRSWEKNVVKVHAVWFIGILVANIK